MGGGRDYSPGCVWAQSSPLCERLCLKKWCCFPGEPSSTLQIKLFQSLVTSLATYEEQTWPESPVATCVQEQGCSHSPDPCHSSDSHLLGLALGARGLQTSVLCSAAVWRKIIGISLI